MREEAQNICEGGKRSLRGGREKKVVSESSDQRRTVTGYLRRRPGDVPEGTQLVIIFLWTLILNLGGHFET